MSTQTVLKMTEANMDAALNLLSNAHKVHDFLFGSTPETGVAEGKRNDRGTASEERAAFFGELENRQQAINVALLNACSVLKRIGEKLEMPGSKNNHLPGTASAIIDQSETYPKGNYQIER